MEAEGRGTYTLIINIRLLNFKPARSHNFPLQDKQLKRARARAKHSCEIRTGDILGNLRLCSVRDQNVVHKVASATNR